MTPATVFDWNHSTKGRLWRSNCVKHHVEPRAGEIFGSTVEIHTFKVTDLGEGGIQL
jgi:hypothetical protein